MSTRTPRSKSKTPRLRPRPKQGSQPDVQVSYVPAEHETVTAPAEPSPTGPRDSSGSAPELSVTESFVGHHPFVAQPLPPARTEQTTLSYGDRISNAPGARTPSRAPSPTQLHGVARSPSQSSSPEISIGESAVGRETLALIAAELLPTTRELPAPDAVSVAAPITRAETPGVGEAANEIPFAIFEMLTFVVQGPETASLSSEALRRRFVEEHLLQRLPAKTMAQVDRVDVTPWTGRGTVVVRVWCKV